MALCESKFWLDQNANGLTFSNSQMSPIFRKKRQKNLFHNGNTHVIIILTIYTHIQLYHHYWFSINISIWILSHLQWFSINYFDRIQPTYKLFIYSSFIQIITHLQLILRVYRNLIFVPSSATGSSWENRGSKIYVLTLKGASRYKNGIIMQNVPKWLNLQILQVTIC